MNDKIIGYKIFINDENVLKDIVFRNSICSTTDVRNKVIESDLTLNELKYGDKGFHFCKNALDCINYIGLAKDSNLVICEIETNNSFTKKNDYDIDLIDGYVCSKYKINKIMDKENLLNHLLKKGGQYTLLFICKCYPYIINENTLTYFENEIKKYEQDYFYKHFSHIEEQEFITKLLDTSIDKKEFINKNKNYLNKLNELIGYYASKCISEHIVYNNNELGKKLFNDFTNEGTISFRKNLELLLKDIVEYHSIICNNRKKSII